jgi:hypothetical protein
MRRISAILYVAVLSSCGNPIPEHASDDRMEHTEPSRQSGPPTIEFYVRRLVANDGMAGPRSASVWSQNDDVDSITVVIAEGLGMVVREAGIDLVGRLAVEGDARIDSQLVPRVVRWLTLTQIKLDSLPSVPGGKRLLAVRPSELWDQYKMRAGGSMAVDSVHVTVDLMGGPRIAGGLSLLWD